MKQSLGKYINIDPGDIPSREDLEGAIIRLKRCAEVLTRMPSKKDPHPSTCLATASFLERLLQDPRIKNKEAPDG